MAIDIYQFGPVVTPREAQGMEFPWDQIDAVVIPLEAIAFPFFVNMTPLVSRLRQEPTPYVEFHQFGHAHRPSTFKLMASITNVATSATVDDSSIFMNGDILELTTGEHVEVVADPDTVANTITISRAMEGTTAAAITVVGGSEPTCYLIANSRTGGEEFQRGLFPHTWTKKNWVQTSQHPAEVSGIFQDTTAWRAAEGNGSPLDFGRMRQLENMMQGYERAFIYGLGASPTTESTKRAKTQGIMARLNGVGNVITPSSGDRAAYTPAMMMRDLYGRIGGQDLLMLSLDWRTAIATWKLKPVVLDMGSTVYNMDIEAFVIPEIGSQTVVYNPMLRAGTALALREESLTLRYMRLPSWFVRGRNGDAVKGDIIARMGIQVDNPELMSAVIGVTGWTG